MSLTTQTDIASMLRAGFAIAVIADHVGQSQWDVAELALERGWIRRRTR